MRDSSDSDIYELSARHEEIEAEIDEANMMRALVIDELEDGSISEACGGGGPIPDKARKALADRLTAVLATLAKLDAKLAEVEAEIEEKNEEEELGRLSDEADDFYGQS